MAIVCHSDLRSLAHMFLRILIQADPHTHSHCNSNYIRSSVSTLIHNTQKRTRTLGKSRFYPFVRQRNEFSFDFSDISNLSLSLHHTHHSRFVVSTTASFIRCRNLFRLTIDRNRLIVYQLFYVHTPQKSLRKIEKVCASNDSSNRKKKKKNKIEVLILPFASIYCRKCESGVSGE